MIELLMITFLQTAEPQPADTAAPAQTTQAAQTEETQERRQICRTSNTTGSRVRRERVCQTEEQRRATQQQLQDRMNGGTQGRNFPGSSDTNEGWGSGGQHPVGGGPG
jgi:hypothetical protein